MTAAVLRKEGRGAPRSTPDVGHENLNEQVVIPLDTAATPAQVAEKSTDADTARVGYIAIDY